MRLTTLRLRGFKSFAEPVTVTFAPGLNAIVGPNGAGKSNVVDALTWVLGTQSPRLLRLGRMDELIFQGTTTRPPLGRAEVELVLSDDEGLLGLGVAEVALTRRVERGGEASYRINRRPARLVDVVEVLQRANIGRTHHVIVSQGEIEAVAASSGEVLRAMLEDASQVTTLRSQRAQTLDHLARANEALATCERELLDLRRQRRPLLGQLERLEQRQQLEQRWREVAYAAGCQRLRELGAALTQARDRVKQASEQLANAEQARGSLSEPAEAPAAVAPEEIVEVLRRLRSRESALRRCRDEIVRALEAARAQQARRRRYGALRERRRELEAELAALEQTATQLAGRRERLERERAGIEVTPLEPVRARLDALRAERARLEATLRERRRARERERRARERRNEDARARLAALSEAAHEAVATIEQVASAIAEAKSAVTTAERRTAAVAEELSAREAAWTHAVAEARSASVVFARLEGERRQLEAALGEQLEGPLAIEEVVPGSHGISVALTLLGELAEARIVEDPKALDPAREQENALVLSPKGARRGQQALGWAPGGLGQRLEEARLVPDVVEALRQGRIDEVLIDAAGWVSDRGWVRRGTSVRAALRLRARELEVELERADHEKERAATAEELHAAALADARRRLEETRGLEERARRRLRELEEAEHSARVALARVDREQAVLRAQLEQDDSDAVDDVGPLEEQLDVRAREELALTEQLRELAEREARSRAAREALEQELVEVRIEAARLAERAREVRDQLAVLDAELESEPAAPEPDRERELSDYDAHAREVLAKVAARVGQLEAMLSIALDGQARQRQAAKAFRAQRDALEDELRRARDVHARALTEEARAEERLRSERDRWAARLGCRPEAFDDAGVAPVSPDGDPLRELEAIEGELQRFGDVNGLARRQLAELDEHIGELDGVVAEARRARDAVQAGLARLESEMRDRLVSTCGTVSLAFDRIVGELFSGGRGVVRLDDSRDPLDAEVRVEVDLPPKRVRRLSLLSGGERSLVSLALLFAVLEVRPVPFLVLDEADAALDERNLVRYVDYLRVLSSRCQVIVVTHQRRTMEVANLLLGVSMAPSGTSTVVRHELER